DAMEGYVNPALRLVQDDPITSYELFGETGFTMYSPNYIHAKTTRRDDATLTFDHKPTRFDELDLKGDYLNSSDPIDFVNGVVTPRGAVTEAGGRGNFATLRVGGAGSYQNWSYAAGDQPDGHSAEGIARLFPVNTRVTRLAANGWVRQLEIGG